MEEEGLFRLAAGSSKVKRLRAEIEAGQVKNYGTCKQNGETSKKNGGTCKQKDGTGKQNDGTSKRNGWTGKQNSGTNKKRRDRSDIEPRGGTT